MEESDQDRDTHKEWFTLTNPLLGEPVVISGSFVWGIFEIAYDWIDTEVEEAKQILRRKDKLAIMGAAGNHRKSVERASVKSHLSERRLND
jgi:hypothetical protein